MTDRIGTIEPCPEGFYWVVLWPEPARDRLLGAGRVVAPVLSERLVFRPRLAPVA
jgi:hypothetical protein